jgi:hypothetical protein
MQELQLHNKPKTAVHAGAFMRTGPREKKKSYKVSTDFLHDNR